MERHQKSEAFAWGNYLPQHRGIIALRYEQSKRLQKCTLCGRYPIANRRAMVHRSLRSVGAESLDAKALVKAVALCGDHAPMTDDELADHLWPGWREGT